MTDTIHMTDTIQKEILKKIQRYIKHRWRTRLYPDWYVKRPTLAIYSRRLENTKTECHRWDRTFFLGRIDIEHEDGPAIKIHPICKSPITLPLDNPNSFNEVLPLTQELWPKG